MRALWTLAALAPLLVLSACASAGGPGSANGWGAPRRADARPAPTRPAPPRTPRTTASDSRRDTERRQAERRDDRRRGDRATPASMQALLIPVEGVDVGELRDSFTAPRSGGRTHRAIDIMAPRGRPALATTDGRITRMTWNRLGGRTLYLRSEDETHDFYYAHLDSYAAGLEVGDRVERGDVVGTVGTTGNARGPHLHFQVLRRDGSSRGTPVNPFGLLIGSRLYTAR